MGGIRANLGWLRRLPKQLLNDKKYINGIKSKVTDGATKAFYFGVPEHSNLGDLAQCYCIRLFLNKYYPEYEVLEIFSRNYLDNTFGLRDFLKKNVRDNDLIFFQSGYCTQDLGGREDFMHQAVIKDFPNNRLVMLPQTVFYNTDERKRLASHTYDAHKKMFFLARDQVSFQIAKGLFPSIPVKCYPDVVTTLIGSYSYDFKRSGVLFCIRNDLEKYYTDKEIEGLIEYFRQRENCERLDTTIRVEPDVIRKDLKKYIEGYFEKFAHYKLIITDRYHGTIFSLIANTPVVVIQTKDHKVKTGVDWFKGHYDDQVLFADSMETAMQLGDSILDGHEYNSNSNYFEKEYYSKLRGVIEKMI
ncbi:Polysaccharide pyruvyl transferase [anaerobic digester metagenome]